MRLISRGGAIMAGSLLALIAAQAEPVRYTPDKWHTRIYFSVSHMGLSNFGGRFLEHEIEFMFDEDDFRNSSVEVTVPVSSIDTFSPELNSKMGSENFFDVEQFPTMHFVSRKIFNIDESQLQMKGDLTIKGVSLPITFDVTYNDKVLHPFYDLNNVGFSATARLDSRAYGVNSLPDWMVASDVDIRIELEAFEGERVPYYSAE